MNKIFAKLRKKNRNQYLILGTCITLSILLVTTYAFIYESPTMQAMLPVGGDTRKLFEFMLGVVFIGCGVFTLYGTKLFLKYKSREYGILTVLGIDKKRLVGALFIDLFSVAVKNIVFGMIASIPLSYVVWTAIARALGEASEMAYRLSVKGIVIGAIFAAILMISILLAGRRFVKRANLMEILHEEQRSEQVHEIKPWIRPVSLIMLIGGMVVAMGFAPIYSRVFMKLAPAYTKALFIIPVVGLYLFLLSAVARTHKGRNPIRYYKNIVNINLMRFTARQTTKNLCVITLLIFVMMMAVFWGGQYYFSTTGQGNKYQSDIILHYPKLEKQVTKEEIHELAKKHGNTIQSEIEFDALQLIINYTQKDLTDDGVYYWTQRQKLGSFVSASDVYELTGKRIDIKPGEYYTNVYVGFKSYFWTNTDCLVEVTHPITNEPLKLTYKGKVECEDLYGLGDPFVFILSDFDYENMRRTIQDEYLEHLVFMQVNKDASHYAFAKELGQMYVAHSTEISDHNTEYDMYAEQLAKREGREYLASEPLNIKEQDLTVALYDWKYAPIITVVKRMEGLKLIVEFVLLSICICIISLTSISIMSYVRSVTIGMQNKLLFEDLRRLGANEAYLTRVLKQQLRCIFTYPCIAGEIVSIVFTILLCYFNDTNFSKDDMFLTSLVIAIGIGISIIMYTIYRVAYHRTRKILGL